VKFLAHCRASIAKNLPNNRDARWVLLEFEAEHGHFIGQVAKALGELKPDKTYRITIEEVD
jgi:hypothetical protein